MKDKGAEEEIIAKTGLRLDPYFSATKLAWILDNVPNARQMAMDGKLAFGTVDCFLLWRLTGGRVHATDATNASRTMLFNIHTQEWDEELLKLFNIPAVAVTRGQRQCRRLWQNRRRHSGCCHSGLWNRRRSAGRVDRAGRVRDRRDQSTYGTGCFVMANTGDKALQSQ